MIALNRLPLGGHNRLDQRLVRSGVATFLVVTLAVMLTQGACIRVARAESATRPHIVIVLADDLGYGDVQPLNPSSTIETPAFNRLAKEGMTFSDAHTPSAVCTPTRYGLLTGRYCWRTRLTRGVLNGYGEPLIDRKRATLASVFSAAGYHTSIVGKWHLGLGLTLNKQSVDLRQPLTFNPCSVGFDESFVIPASLDFPPYVYFRGDRPTTTETVDHAASGFPAFTRKGPRAVDFDMQGCLDRLADEAVGVIESIVTRDQPTMLYFPLTAPHKPVLPAKRFEGSTQLGPYGDFVTQVDATVGRIIDALDQASVLDQTILIVTSDNGSFMKRVPPEQKDHVDDDGVQGFHPSSHKSNGPWRGTKADIWEAGHRVPFFVRLPNQANAGSKVTQTVGLVDVMATLADHLNVERASGSGPDSISFANVLQDPNQTFRREPLICHSAAGMFAIREGKWKLVAGNGSGGRQQPKGKPFAKPWALFDLEKDLGETMNLADRYPKVVDRLSDELERIRGRE
ncbi:MAG: sulfatase-like hydrolase/transferase [Planctomycetota bacterium]